MEDILLDPSLLIKLNGWLTGDPVDVVRQQDQHHPPGRLRRADQVSGPGTRHLKAFLPSIHNISRRILQQIQWEMEYFLLLHWTSSDAVQWKSFKPYPALCESRPTKCSPPRAYCSTLLAARQPNTFLDFRPRILLQFTLLTVIGSSGPTKVQTFRNSNCLLWLPQHLKEKCGPGISPPIQILRSFQSDLFTFQKWKPCQEESKFHSQRATGYLVVIWYNNKEKQRAGYYLIS